MYTRLDTEEGEKDLYRLARQRDRDGRDMQQVRVIKDRDGNVLTGASSVRNRWKEYCEKLMNEENERGGRVEEPSEEGGRLRGTTKDENGKAVGPDDLPVEAKSSRLHCSHCDETYSLPQNGAIKLYKELRCPLDDFELVLWTSGTRGKSYPLCPYCFSNPPFRDMKKNVGCNECSHPSCQHSFNSLGIGQCVECDSGVLVLDPTSAPKWKMSCNRCNVVVHFFEHAHRVQVAQENCNACDALLVTVVFNKAQTPLPACESQHTGCVFCDPVFQDLVALKHATMRHPMHRGGGARRGQGRGRGRRGPPKKPKDKMAELAAYFV